MGRAKPTTHQYPIPFETTHNDITYHISSIAMEGSGGGGGCYTIQFNSIQFIYEVRAFKGQQENCT